MVNFSTKFQRELRGSSSLGYGYPLGYFYSRPGWVLLLWLPDLTLDIYIVGHPLPIFLCLLSKGFTRAYFFCDWLVLRYSLAQSRAKISVVDGFHRFSLGQNGLQSLLPSATSAVRHWCTRYGPGNFFRHLSYRPAYLRRLMKCTFYCVICMSWLDWLFKDYFDFEQWPGYWTMFVISEVLR